MSLQTIPLDKISEADVQRLIRLGVAESPYMDYNRESYCDGGEDRSEFLADVSSFANTLGGDLVIGVAEANGVQLRCRLSPGHTARNAFGHPRCDMYDSQGRGTASKPR